MGLPSCCQRMQPTRSRWISSLRRRNSQGQRDRPDQLQRVVGVRAAGQIGGCAPAGRSSRAQRRPAAAHTASCRAARWRPGARAARRTPRWSGLQPGAAVDQQRLAEGSALSVPGAQRVPVAPLVKDLPGPAQRLLDHVVAEDQAGQVLPVEVTQVMEDREPAEQVASATRNGRTVCSVGRDLAARNSSALEPHSLAQSQSIQAQYDRPVSAQCCRTIAAACAPARRNLASSPWCKAARAASSGSASREIALQRRAVRRGMPVARLRPRPTGPMAEMAAASLSSSSRRRSQPRPAGNSRFLTAPCSLAGAHAGAAFTPARQARPGR